VISEKSVLSSHPPKGSGSIINTADIYYQPYLL